MTSFGLPTLVQTRGLQQIVSDTRAELSSVQVEAVTGLAEDVSAAVRGDVGRVQELEKLLADNQQRLVSIESLGLELEFVQSALSPIQERAGTLSVEIAGALQLSDATGLEAFRIEADQELRSVFGRLNTSFGGSNVFSGAAVDVSPLGSVDTLLTDVAAIVAAGPDAATITAALDTYFNTAGGGFQTTIYQGSTAAAPTREIADGQRLGVDITPLDAEIRDAIRAFATFAVAEANAPDAATFEALARDVSTALGQVNDQVISRQAVIGAQEAELELLRVRNLASTDAITSELNSLLGVDQFEAASRLNLLETQLQASFLVTSRVQSLSLVNFL